MIELVTYIMADLWTVVLTPILHAIIRQMLMTLGSVGDTTEGNEGIENLPTL